MQQDLKYTGLAKMIKIEINVLSNTKIIDEIIEWTFKNINGKYIQYGLPMISSTQPDTLGHRSLNVCRKISWNWCFEDEKDALLFKLRWQQYV